jgi:hypothetical protein
MATILTENRQPLNTYSYGGNNDEEVFYDPNKPKGPYAIWDGLVPMTFRPVSPRVAPGATSPAPNGRHLSERILDPFYCASLHTKETCETPDRSWVRFWASYLSCEQDVINGNPPYINTQERAKTCLHWLAFVERNGMDAIEDDGGKPYQQFVGVEMSRPSAEFQQTAIDRYGVSRCEWI